MLSQSVASEESERFLRQFWELSMSGKQLQRASENYGELLECQLQASIAADQGLKQVKKMY